MGTGKTSRVIVALRNEKGSYNEKDADTRL